MLKTFLKDRSGSYAIMTAALSVPLMLGVGLAVDYSRLSRAHSKIQELADGAALALAASKETDKDKLKTMAENYVRGNFGDGSLQNLSIEKLDLSNSERIAIVLDADVPAAFMGIANHNTLDVKGMAVAIRGVSGSVEVALVLDNTDSMNQDNKIGTLKEAATNLVGELFKNKDAKVRVALVPYAEQINVGMKYRKAPWLSVTDDYSNTTVTYTFVPEQTYQPMKSTGKCLKWKEAGSRQVEKDGVMVTETWPKSCSEYEMVPDGPVKVTPAYTKEDKKTTTFKWFGCVGARVDKSKVVLDDLSPQIKYPGMMASSQKCLTEIQPLTNDKATVTKAIAAMITSRSGYTPNTYIPGGMTWGINVLSKSEPFDEGEDYDEKNMKPRKVIVLMTDGLNTMRVRTSGVLNIDYLLGTNFIGDTISASASQRKQTNADTITLCNYAKSKKIEIFTVAFKVDDGEAKSMLQSCASDAQHYYDASDPKTLIAAFADIAQTLVRVRLAE